MRPRLTVAFGLLALVLVGTFVAFRTLTITDLARQDLRAQLDREAMVLAAVLADDSRTSGGELPTRAALAPYAVPDRRLVVTLPGAGTLEVAGPAWEEAAGPVAGSAAVDGVVVRVTAPQQEVDRAVAAALPSLLLLGAALVLLAIAVGEVVARRLSKPFVALAEAANALARGRLDLRLPRTRIGEARAIAVALEGGARQLRDSLRRERDLALRASHELRTPLTGLRLELHELTGRDDVPADLVEAADRAAAHIDRIDAAVNDVLEETRSHPVVSDALLPLGLVAPALAQRWSDTLALAGVDLDVRLTGDSAVPLTPGPLEQLLDDVLLEVLGLRGERVHLTFDGGDRHLRITVVVDGAAVDVPLGGGTSNGGSGALDRARAVAETVGGRTSGSLASSTGLVVVVPRR